MWTTLIFASATLASNFTLPCLNAISWFNAGTLNTKLSDDRMTVLTRAVDAFGKPNGVLMGTFTSLGNINECRAIPRTIENRKVLPMRYATVLGSLNVLDLQLQSKLGVCVPEACTSKSDIQSILFEAFAGQNLSYFTQAVRSALLPTFSIIPDIGDIPKNIGLYTVLNVHEDVQLPWSTGAIVMLLVLVSILLLVLSGTALDYFDQNRGQHKKNIELSNDVPMPPSPVRSEAGRCANDNDVANEKETLLVNDTTSISVRPTPLKRFLNCFSLYKTLPELFSTKPSRYPQLNALNVLRVISIWWIAVGHSYGSFISDTAFLDYVTILKQIDSAAILIIINAFLAVDTFFYLSAFLVAYMIFMRPDVTLLKFNYLKYALHRYLRLTPVNAFVLFLFYLLFPYMGSGPLWFGYKKVQDQCSKYWWTNLIYINNFYPSKISKECMGWGWYMAADFHLYLLAPVFIWPFLKKSTQRFGWILAGVTFFICALVTIIPSAIYDISAVISVLDPPPGDSFDYLTENTDNWHAVFYENSYNHITVSLIAILTAFMCVQTKSVNRQLTLLMPIFGAGFMLATLFIPYSFVSKKTRWGAVANAFYNYLSRIFWSVGLSLILFPSVVNPRSTRILTNCYGWRGWIVLARLTFSLYMTHCFLINLIYGEFTNEGSFSVPVYIFYYGGILFWSYIAAVLLFLFVEQPFASLIKQFLG